MTESFPEQLDFADVDFTQPTILNKKPNRFRRCPVVVTLADSQVAPVDIQKMLEAGMNVAKFKMSTSTRGDRIRLLGKVDKAAAACCKKFGVKNWPVATCVELKTCIVKTGVLESNEDYVEIEEGSTVVLTHNIVDFNKCNKNRIFVDNPYLTTEIKIGTEISLAADEIIMKCTSIVDEKSIKCLVTKGGYLTSLCIACARDIIHSRPHLTRSDLQIIKFALEYQVDLIIINYVRHTCSVKKIKQCMGKKIERPVILCGICTQEGLDNFDDILEECDGIILSREILPYELPASKLYRLPNIQKWMAGKCLQAGKPLFISGGVFEEALKHGNFLDNEIMDVSNAILDGVSGFILKDCYNTEIVLEVLRAMNELSYSVDPFTTSKTAFKRIIREVSMPLNAAEAAVVSCAAIANHSNARLIVIPTVSGKTVKLLNRMRPSCLIVTVSTKIRVTRVLHTCRGVMPLMYTGSSQGNWKRTIHARIDFAVEYAVKRSWLQYGDYYITLQRGSESSSYCDMVRIWKVSISKKPLVECPDETDETFMSNLRVNSINK